MTLESMPDAEILIIGGGVMGLATAVSLAEQATSRVAVLDASDPPHDQGAHHGHSRLIRVAYGEGRCYVHLARRALAGWHALAAQHPGRALYEPCGVLNVGDVDDAFIAEVAASAQDFSLNVDMFSGSEAAARWPGWSLDDMQRACFEAEAGVLFCEAIVAAWCEQLDRAADVERYVNAPIVELAEHGNGYRARAADGRCWQAPRVLLACGRAVTPLAASLDITLPLQRQRKVFAWFEADERYSAATWPGFSYTGALGDYYGFPALGGHGVKIGRHDGGEPVDHDANLAPFGCHTADESDLRALADRHLPGVGRIRRGAVCEYIRTPDEDFIIDSPRPGLYLAAGFSGHGFKFAPAVGEALANWIAGGRARPTDFEPFRLDRFSA